MNIVFCFRRTLNLIKDVQRLCTFLLIDKTVDRKIATLVASCFSSAYTFYWNKFFPTQPLDSPPFFDGRVVAYPREDIVKDYFSWRQVDCHVNNLYNTTFWTLLTTGISPREAELFINKRFNLHTLSQPPKAPPAPAKPSSKLQNELTHEPFFRVLKALHFTEAEIGLEFPQSYSESSATVPPPTPPSSLHTLLTLTSPVAFKNEIMHCLGKNYNNEMEQHKKGTCLYKRIVC